MTFDRRSILAASLGLGAATAAAHAGQIKAPREAAAAVTPANAPTLQPDAAHDQTAILQAAIDAAAAKDVPLVLPPGTFRVSDLRLRAGTRLLGASRTTVLQFAGGDAFVTADKADGLVLQGLVFDGAFQTFNDARGEGLLTIANAKGLAIDDIEIRNSARGGLSLIACAGRVSNITISDMLDFGIKSLDASGLDITGNTVTGCANNGILVWRTEKGEDGTTVTGNRISKIRNASGGTGEYGNAINVYKAASVLVAQNRISDCAYTAIRGNAASNIQILSNSCERLGEVAIYSEFGFEGALIANNTIEFAATGISVTNFNEGGRLAVIQGNLIRNLFRREHEKEDKRGEGIGVEADAVVSGNTIEGAPTVGIQIGWGSFMRDVAVTGNVVRRSKVGISVTSAPDAGACLIANNLISKTDDGAIRRMTLGVTSGPDLAREPSISGRMTVTGNVAV
ncbi:MAG: TIGR03808 family TAT-translocated repetitive protein [Hyphomicrobium sp.]|nr:TIGR03808 family TAT-translocated repetitive protein [Hyphomicrobium sp.]